MGMHSAINSRPLPLGRRLVAAVISGFVVAVVTHLVTVLVFFVSNGATLRGWDNVPVNGCHGDEIPVPQLRREVVFELHRGFE